MDSIDITYFGHTVALPDLPEYQKFYAKLRAEIWEPKTFATLKEFLDKDTIYVDIGGWIGVTPFWASHLAKRVITVEPDPKCRAILKALAPRYPNVTVIEGALSPDKELKINAVAGFGSSETSALAIGDGEAVAVPGLSIVQVMPPTEEGPVFVKVDIEGYEYEIADEIAKLSRYRVKGLQVAVHPHLYARTLEGPKVLRRFKAAAATRELARRLAPASCALDMAPYASLSHYLWRSILLRGSPKGTDFLYRAAT